jgi:hypothetical protein
MAVQIQLRNDTAASWSNVNPVLAQGELGIERDTGLIKIGNGSATWANLAYSSVASSEISFTYPQNAVSNNWVINHNLGYYPNIQIFDSGNNMVEGNVTHSNTFSLTVSFSAGLSGIAYLS